MFRFIAQLFSKENKTVFTKEYRESYRKSWINNIRNYSP